MPPSDRGFMPRRGSPVVDDRRAGRRSGSRELGVVAEKGMEARVDVETGPDRLEERGSPRRRELAAGRGDADEERVGLRRHRHRFAERRDGRNVVAR